jgi:hypothetical protein
MAKCSRCGRVYAEPADEQGDHPCECPMVADDWGYDGDDDEEVAEP